MEHLVLEVKSSTMLECAKVFPKTCPSGLRMYFTGGEVLIEVPFDSG